MKKIQKLIFTQLLFFILAFVAITTGYAQNKYTVTGTVKDANTKEAMVSVNVIVAGTITGTTTDINGNYSLLLPSLENISLKFSFLGYTEIIMPVKGQSVINIEMSEDVQLINEIVVVAYGKQKKESVIGSISSISGKELTNLAVSNISQGLAGRVAGVMIVQPSGEVGKDDAEMYIRGRASFNDNTQPIYVVDGIERQSITQIDPNEIQSFNVLKDASATAVYGIRGANGVIIITTKRGKTGAPKVSISAQTAVTQPTRIPRPLGAYQAAALRNIHMYNSGKNDNYTALELLQYRTNASPYSYPDVDWVGEVMKDHSTMQQYNINVGGGTEFVRYFVSAGYLSQNGFYKHDDNTRFSRYNFRSNLDFDLSSKLSVSFNLGARIEKRRYPGAAWYGSWPIYRGAFAVGGRTYPVYNPDGSYGTSISDNDYNNLVAKLENSGVYKNTKSVVEMGLNGTYKLDAIIPGLAARVQVAFDNSGENATLWNKTYATYEYNLANDSYQKIGEDASLYYDWGNGTFDQKLYLEAGLEYSRTIGKNSVTGLLLANRDDRVINTFISLASQGLLGRATYDYDKRYFVEVNVGYNGSENFPKSKRYGLFPAFALGWMVSNEAFIWGTSLSNFISMFKIRGSIGWVGNDKLGGDITKQEYHKKRFIYLQTYDNVSGGQAGIGDTYMQGIRQGSIANYDVTWEVARKSNIGFESDFWHGLLGVTFDYFYEYRDKILVDEEEIKKITPEYVGANFKPANLGVVENRGFEVELSHRNRVNKNFSYFVKGNVSFAQNKVLQQADPEGMLPYQRQAGYSVGVRNMYKAIGIFQSYEDIANSPSQLGLPGNTEVHPGDLKYLDFNNDGVINTADAFRQGYGKTPEIQYGFTVGTNYKGFDFNILFQGSGRSQFPKNWEIMWHFSNNDNVFQKHWNYWSPENSGNEEYVRLYGAYQNNEPGGAEGSTYSMGSGNYLKLKSMELGYTLPTEFTKKVKIESVRVYLSGINLYLWAKEPYLDPDNRDERGGLMPQTRAYNFGISINF